MPKLKKGQGTKNKKKSIYKPKPKRKRDKGYSRLA